MNKLEQMRERAIDIMFKYFDDLESCETVDQRITSKEHAEYWLTNLITEVWNEATKEEWRRCVDVLDFDHSKCLTKESCIGYENAQSDLMNQPPIEGMEWLPIPDITSDKRDV